MTSALAPIDLSAVPESEKEDRANWLFRHIVQSLPGRVTYASLETLKASTSVLCLSPWGDGNPVLLPCIRVRDVVIHTAIAATGGTAVFAAPAVSHALTEVVSVAGDSLLVEIGVYAGFKATTDVANELLADLVYKRGYDVYRDRKVKMLTTTDVKTMTMTLKFKHILSDAYIGYFRGSEKVHKSTDLWTSENAWSVSSWSTLTNPLKEYLSISKGWFCPYLYATARRPVIPRKLSPDIVFSHGPFLEGDYAVARQLLVESNNLLQLSTQPAEVPPESEVSSHKSSSSISSSTSTSKPMSFISSFAKPRSTVEQPVLTTEPPPRRLVILVLGIRPHRAGLWTSSSRPGESILQYQLLNGCPTICVPAKNGCPLQAWDTLTLRELQKVALPSEEKDLKKQAFNGIVTVLWEFVSLCIDWERVHLPDTIETTENPKNDKESTVKAALELLVEAAVRTRDSKVVQKEVDLDRAGIVMMRVP